MKVQWCCLLLFSVFETVLLISSVLPTTIPCHFHLTVTDSESNLCQLFCSVQRLKYHSSVIMPQAFLLNLIHTGTNQRQAVGEHRESFSHCSGILKLKHLFCCDRSKMNRIYSPLSQSEGRTRLVNVNKTNMLHSADLD